MRGRVRVTIQYATMLLTVLALTSRGAWPADAAQFLELTLDARTAAMASAATALSGDLSGFWINPASTYWLPYPELRATYRNELEDVNSGHVVFGMPVAANGVFSAGLFTLHAGQLEMNNGEANPIAEMDLALAATYAVDLAKFFNWPYPVAAGVDLMYLHSDLAGEFIGQALAGDFGLISKLPYEDLSVGFSLRHFGTQILFDLEADTLPTTMNFGLAWDKTATTDLAFQLAADLSKPFYSPLVMQVGTEFNYRNTLFVRGGYKFFHDTDSFTVGAGVRAYHLTFDYSFLQNLLAPKHMVTVSYRFAPLPAAEPTTPTAVAAVTPTPIPTPIPDASGGQAESNQWVAQAIAYCKEGRFTEAEVALRKALQVDPNNLYAARYLDELPRIRKEWSDQKNREADALFAQGETADAAALYLSILRANPADERAQAGYNRILAQADKYLATAKTAMAKGQWAAALGGVQEALNVLPTYDKALNLREELLAELGKRKESEKAVRATIAQSRTLAQAGKLEAAVKLLEQALISNPGSTALREAKAEVPRIAHAQALKLRTNAKYLEAIKLWKKIIAVAPDFLVAKQALEETEKYYREQIQKLSDQAQKAYGRTNYAQAISLWEKAYAFSPDPDITAFLVRAYEAQGIQDYRQDRLLEAVSYWQKALRLNPNLPNIRKNIKRAKNKIQFLKELGWEVTQ